MRTTELNYTDIAPAGGDTGAPLNLRQRLALIQRFVPLESATLLDCGCGTGQYVEALRRIGVAADGIEFSADKVAEFRKRHPGVSWISQGDVEHIDRPAQSVDAVLFNEVLEHVPDDRQALCEAYRILKPCGILLVFSPNRRYPIETHGATLRRSGRRVPTYVPLIPYVPLSIGRHIFRYHARNYWPAELERLVVDAGFRVIHRDYLWPTLENISGEQPAPLRRVRPALKALVALLKTAPGVRTLGVSQVIIAQRQ